MTRSMVKVIFSYIVFVGVPVVALIGILRIGRGLTAPVSVSGLWTVTTNIDPSAPCVKSMELLQQNKIAIVQSGRSLVIIAGKEKGMTSAGSIAGDQVSGTLLVSSAMTQEAAPACRFLFHARLNAHVQPRTLDGKISTVGASTEPFRFHATRESTLN